MNSLLKRKFAYAISIGVLLFLAACQSAQKVEQVKLAPFIESPLPHLDIKYTEYSFDAEEGALLEYSSGTKIKIAPNSLSDTAGNAIQGEVKLKYREFHNTLDVLLSGIPMKYDSAGIKQVFQTAGMYDIRAFQENMPLKIASNKTVEIQMASFQPENDYNFYYLDTVKRKWVYQATAKAKPNLEKIKKQAEIDALRPTPFSDMFILNYGQAVDIAYGFDWKLVQQNLDVFSQKLKPYGINYFKDLRIDDKVYFQGNSYPAFDMVWKKLEDKPLPPWLNESDLEWYVADDRWVQAAKIVQIAPGVYHFIIHNPKKHRYFALKIQPVMRISSMLRFSPDYWDKNYQDAMDRVAEKEKKIKKVADVFRSIEISDFGVYNYDRYLKISDAIVVKADFKLKSGTQSPRKVYFINTKDRAVIPYAPPEWTRVSLSKDTTAQFFAIMPDYSIATYSRKDYQNIDFKMLTTQSNPTYDFELTAQTDLIKTREALEKALNLN